MLDAIRSLRAWQIGVLVAVVFGAVGASYGAYALTTGTDSADLEEDQQLIVVRSGDLVNEVSTNGSLVYPNRETLTFGVQGAIGEVLVDEGQSVVQGQNLVTLDAATVASLAKAVAQAQVNLDKTNEALVKARDPHTALELAQTEADVSSAWLSLRNAEDAVEKLQPTSQQIAQAEALFAGSALALQTARDAVDGLLNPTAQEVARAESAVTDARLAVDNATAALDSLRSGPSDEDVDTAQLQIDSAATTLANAQRDLALATDTWNDNVQTKQDAADAARDGYREAFERWLGVDLSETDEALDPDALLASWGVDLASLFDPNSRYYDLAPWVAVQGIAVDDPATQWDESVIYTWLNFYPGAIAADCANGAVPHQGACVSQELSTAWDAHSKAISDLASTRTQQAKAVDSATIAVARAEDALSAERQDLTDLYEAAGALETEAKEKQLALLLVNLDVAEQEIAELLGGPDTLEADSKQRQVDLAEADLAKAEEDLGELVAGADPMELEAKQQQVTVAQAILTQAEEDLDEIRNSPDPLEIALRETEVASSLVALSDAETDMANAILTAPMDGVVSLINVEAGSLINPNTPVLEVVDPTVVEVDGIVDEIDVLYVRVGASATVTMDALAGQVLEGVVSDVGSAARSQQGVVSYPIRIQVQVPAGITLPEGLSAVAGVVIREDRDVLLVPLQALYGTFDQPLVRVISAGVIEERPVVLGNSDDFWAVVQGGLAEGEQLVMQAEQASTTGFGFGGGFRPGGGFGGGGFGGGRPTSVGGR